MKTFEIKIPTTSGFLERQCHSTNCHKIYKISTRSLLDNLYCPYCGEHQMLNQTTTEAQLDYVNKVALEEAKDYAINTLQHEFEKIGKAAHNKLFNITLETNSHQKRHIKQPKSVDCDSEITCPSCNYEFQIYGIFGYCPKCRDETIKIYDADIQIIKRDILNSNDKMRQLRHAYEDLVSTFEGFCKKKASIEAKANFQNLRNTRQYFRKYLSIDIYINISEEEKVVIKRVFMKRHLYTHPKGIDAIISEEYIRQIPSDIHLLGSKAELSINEFEEAASILRKIINNLIN